MIRTLTLAGLAAGVLVGLLLWQRYGLAVAISDAVWFCFGA